MQRKKKHGLAILCFNSVRNWRSAIIWPRSHNNIKDFLRIAYVSIIELKVKDNHFKYDYGSRCFSLREWSKKRARFEVKYCLISNLVEHLNTAVVVQLRSAWLINEKG